MNLEAHVSELKRKHADLSRRVEAEQRRPGADETALSQLKRRKLRLKEEIARYAPASV